MGSNNTFEKIKVMLKKEFSKKDVNRARNLIMGKADASVGTQVGYKKEIKNYKEGDVWTEGRKTWTIKNGIKQTVSKLDKIKKEVFMPLCCPKCNKVMKKRLDKPNYKIHKMCHDCVIEFEHKIQVQGLDKYLAYKDNLKKQNKLSILKEVESQLLGWIDQSNSGFVSEDGVVERWVGGIDKKKVTKNIKEAAKKAKDKLKNL
jgi:hypothetical protein